MTRVLVPFLTAVLVITVMVAQSLSRETVVAEAPDVHLGEIEGFSSRTLEAGEAEKKVLPTDTRIERRCYTGADGHCYTVSLVVGGKTKNSIHRPELCLPSQGFLMRNPHEVEVGGGPWHVLTLEGTDGYTNYGFAYTFFNQEGYRTSSHIQRIFRDVIDRSVDGRIDRWVMVTVFSTATGARQTAFLAKLKGIVR